MGSCRVREPLQDVRRCIHGGHAGSVPVARAAARRRRERARRLPRERELPVERAADARGQRLPLALAVWAGEEGCARPRLLPRGLVRDIPRLWGCVRRAGGRDSQGPELSDIRPDRGMRRQ